MQFGSYEDIRPKAEPERFAEFMKRSPCYFGTKEEVLNQKIAEFHSAPKPCPNCNRLHNVFDCGDETQIVGKRYKGKYLCPSCSEELTFAFLISGGWEWRYKNVPSKTIAPQLSKADEAPESVDEPKPSGGDLYGPTDG